MTTTVLIGFADALSAPEVAWSLVGSGFRVIAFAKDTTRPALSKSRFVGLEYVTDPAESIHRSLAELQMLVQRLGKPILMALDDASLLLIRELSKRGSLRVAGPIHEEADVALDKRLQLDAALAAGFL